MNDLVMFVARRAAIIRIVAFSSTEGDRHLGIRPVSQLNTWPVVSPVNASRRPSRDAAHHSGSGRMARPSPWGTFTSYSLPAFPGALRVGVILIDPGISAVCPFWGDSGSAGSLLMAS